MSQFKRLQNPPLHQFIVFSIVSDDVVVPRFSQCNNCGLIHKIVDLTKSEIVSGKEHMNSILTIDEIKQSLNERLVVILESNNCDLATWEAAQFIVENQRWGDYVVLSTDNDTDAKHGKICRILGDSLYKIDSFSRNETI